MAGVIVDLTKPNSAGTGGADDVTNGWELYETFHADLSAGNIDGTYPLIGGPRSTSTTGSISGGTYVLTGAAGDSIWYDNAITRASGVIMLASIAVADVTNVVEFGFDTNEASALAAAAARITGDTITAYDGGTAGPAMYVPLDATDYKMAIVLASSGAYYLIYDESDWLLMNHYGSNQTSTLYAGLANTSASGTVAYAVIPKARWVPPKRIADTFTGATSDGGSGTGIETGGSGESWTGTNWANEVGGGVSNSPALTGSELITNGDMELDSDWANYGSPTTNERSSTQKHGGTYSRRVVTSATSKGITQTVSQTVGAWYEISGWFYVVSGSARIRDQGGVNTEPRLITDYATGASWQKLTGTYRATNTSMPHYLVAGGAAEFYADDLTLKQKTTADLFYAYDTADPHAYIEAAWTRGAVSLQYGVFACLDSASNPQNYINAYLGVGNNETVTVTKTVAGVTTELSENTITYSADALVTIRTLPSGSDIEVYVFYDGAKVANHTITDAGIISNTLHGLFSTGGNTCSEATIYDSTGHTTLARWEPA